MKRVECVEGEKKLMNDRHFLGRDVGGRKENVSMTLGHLFFITAISVSFCIHHHPQLQQHFTLRISSEILITASPFFHQDDKRRHCNDDSKAKIYESGEENIIDGSCMEEISIKILAGGQAGISSAIPSGLLPNTDWSLKVSICCWNARRGLC